MGTYETGDRRINSTKCTCTAASGTFGAGSASNLTDGTTGTNVFMTSGSIAGKWIQFDFGSGHAFRLTDAWLRQNGALSHGTWQWECSDDASSWTSIGSTFTLGNGLTTQTFATQLASNTTAHRYYRILGISGSGNAGAGVTEMMLMAYGVNWLYVTSDGVLSVEAGGCQDGSITTFANFANGGAVANRWIMYDMCYARFCVECKWYQSASTSQGTWKWQGSNDNSAWADIGSSFTLGGATTQTQTQLNGNSTAYRFYRLLGVSGNTSWPGFGGVQEMEFSFDTDPAPPPAGGIIPLAVHHRQQQGLQ